MWVMTKILAVRMFFLHRDETIGKQATKANK